MLFHQLPLPAEVKVEYKVKMMIAVLERRQIFFSIMCHVEMSDVCGRRILSFKLYECCFTDIVSQML